MQLSELVATLHHEVTKSCRFISETRGAESAENSVLHIGIDRVEIDLPVTLGEQVVEFDPSKLRGTPVAFKRLAVPFAPAKGHLPAKRMTGTTVTATIVGHVEKLDDRVSPESVGRLRISFKPVIS